jgi:hypothetical protein
MPTISKLLARAALTAALMQAFIPGASPPLVSMAIFFMPTLQTMYSITNVLSQESPVIHITPFYLSVCLVFPRLIRIHNRILLTSGAIAQARAPDSNAYRKTIGRFFLNLQYYTLELQCIASEVDGENFHIVSPSIYLMSVFVDNYYR